MRNQIQTLIANEELCNYFTASANNSSLSHAYILLGAKGTGKHTLARMIAASLTCEQKHIKNARIPCNECNHCRKIAENISPDLIFIGREDKATIGVDAVRFIKNDIASYPIDGDFKIYVIEDAHTMTKQAQNALLLTLEEPPAYAVFILLCEHTETILETVKSRAPILRLKTPTEQQAMDYLIQNHPNARSFINSSPDEFSQIYKISAGSIGRILELIGSQEKKTLLEDRLLAQKLIESIAHHRLANNFSEISAMFSQKRDDRDRLISQLVQIQSALRDIMALKKADAPSLVFFTDAEYAEELSYCFSMQKISEILNLVEGARISVLRNANVKLTIVNLLSKLI